MRRKKRLVLVKKIKGSVLRASRKRRSAAAASGLKRRFTLVKGNKGRSVKPLAKKRLKSFRNHRSLRRKSLSAPKGGTYDEGFNQGYDAGFNAGLAKGFEDGLEETYKEKEA